MEEVSAVALPISASVRPCSTDKKVARREKLEKLRRDKHATTIQSHWRGCRARGYMKIFCDRKNEKGNYDLLVKDHSPCREGPIEKGETTPSNVEELKEGSTDRIPPPDKSMESFEWLEGKHESFDGVCDGESAWPDLVNADPSEVRQWVYTHKKVLVRAITWNMEAKKPPPVEELQRHLLPLNRCSLVFTDPYYSWLSRCLQNGTSSVCC